MTQKQMKFAKSNHRAKRTMEDYDPEFRKPTLASLGDLNRMAMESSRARLISQLVRPEDDQQGEFSSCCDGLCRKTGQPCLKPSPNQNLTKKKTPVVTAYPSIVQALRWCPNVATSDDDIYEPLPPEENKIHCKCKTCAMQDCHIKMYPNSYKSVGFRGNIMTFCDQYTMTPKLRDASCSCGPKPPLTSDVSVCVSEVAVRDTFEEMPCRPIYATQKCSPIPILKKPCKDFGLSYSCKGYSDDYEDKVVRDIEDCLEKRPKRVKSIKSFLKLRQRNYEPSDHEDCPRINIYNEGISDSIANQLPIIPSTVTHPINVKKGRSRVPVKAPSFTDIETEVYIPYSHRLESKYHDGCKKTVIPDYYEADDDAKNVAARPAVLRKWVSKPFKIYRPPCIKLPKKLLTSERNIDTYLSKAKPKLPSRNR